MSCTTFYLLFFCYLYFYFLPSFLATTQIPPSFLYLRSDQLTGNNHLFISYCCLSGAFFLLYRCIATAVKASTGHPFFFACVRLICSLGRQRLDGSVRSHLFISCWSVWIYTLFLWETQTHCPDQTDSTDLTGCSTIVSSFSSPFVHTFSDLHEKLHSFSKCFIS